MRNFNIAADIDAPPSRVWDVMVDVERWHEWTQSITSIKRKDSGPFSIGSSARVVQPKLLPAIWTVTLLEPGRSFTWESAGPGMRVIGTHTVEPTARGSRVTLSVRFDGVFGGLLGTLLHNLNEQYLSFEAAGLKRRSEQT